MKTNIVHFTDLHFTGSLKTHQLNLKRDRILDVILAKISVQTELVIFVVSGDVISQGDVKGFKQAEHFFLSLKQKIFENKNIKTELVFSPGNHDNVIEEDSEERDELIDLILNDKKGKIEDYQKVYRLKEYDDFIMKFQSDSIVEKNMFFTQYSFETSGHQFDFTSYASSILYKKESKQGDFIFEKNKYRTDLVKNPSNLNLSVSHYPIEWLDNETEETENEFTYLTDISFTGHIHRPKSEIIIENARKRACISSRALNMNTKREDSGFGIIFFYNYILLISAFDYHLEGGRYIQENSFLGYSLRNSITTHGNLPLNIEYRDNLLKSNLDDILEGNFNTYINPTVTMQRYIEKDEEYIYDEVNVFSLLEEEAYIYNLRSLEGGGKTTLLKKSYLKMHELGKIPIFIDGSELKNISTVNFLAFLEEAYKKQYSTRVHGDYYLIPEDKFILMIDDIEKVNSNQNNVRNVLEYIVGGYKKVIFTSKNKFLNDNITIDNLGIQELYLKEFGHAQTHELICGWAKNLEPSSVNDESQLVVHFKDLFEEMKQKNNVPRTPTFLSILFEAFQDNNYQEIIDGTRVDFYKYIHEKIQKKISLQAKLNPDFVENLLKEIAYNLFTKKYNFSSDEFLEFMVKEYEYKRVKFYSSVERFLNVTENLKILSSNYVFNNEYSYHYYVASYLTYNLNDNIEEILKLIEDLSIHENLEIINFIIYFTGDSRILDKIKEILDKMFVEFPEFDLDDQARVLAPFFKLPKEIGKEGHIPERKRQEFYESLDSKKKEIEKVKKKHKLEKKTDFQKNISKSYGLMDLIEQLMKKHGDKLSGKHKKDLIKGAIQLGLRICQTAMYVYFKKIKHAMQIEKEEEIRELIPKLASIIDYLIHKISIKIGSIKCEISLLKVLDKYDYYTKEVLKLYYYNEYGLVEKERLKTDLYGSLYRNAQKSFHNFVSVSLYANYLRISRYLGITDEINFELLSKMGIDGRSRAKLLQEARESKKTIESKKEIN